MTHNIKYKIPLLLSALFVVTTLVLPVRVQAITGDQLLILFDKSSQLCAASSKNQAYVAYCSYSTITATHVNKLKSLNEAQRIDYVKSLGNSLDAPYLKSVDAYNKAVDAGDVVQSSSSSSGSAVANCPDGSVEVSISPGGSDITPTTNGTSCVAGKNPIYTYLRGIILFMGGAIGLAVVITIIISGIQYSSSAGNPANITKAKERLMNAVIGLVLYLFLAAILRYLVPQIFSA